MSKLHLLRTALVMAASFACACSQQSGPECPGNAADCIAPDGGDAGTDGGPDAGCDGGENFDPAIGSCVDACNPTGLLHDQALAVGALTRHYMLHVPPTYSCDGGTPFPLLIDFHGTWTGAESDHGEEFYALQGLLDAADARGFIVARPRSLFSTEGGVNTYRWDENRGDLAKNALFAHALVEHLAALYRVDPLRTYAIGFSSGTNMAAQLFADQTPVFHGFGFVGGGVFGGEEPSSVHLDGPPIPRMYGVSGYRDYLYLNEQMLLSLLEAHHYPRDHCFERTDSNGHELYGWHYLEMFDWVDQGVRPDAGTAAVGWSAEQVPGSDDLIALASDTQGGLVAAASGGALYRRSSGGGWSLAARLQDTSGVAPAFSGLCVLASGAGVSVGESFVARTSDHGASWSLDGAIPAFIPGFFDIPFINAVGCSDDELVAVGYWDAAHSSNGVDWTATSAQALGGAFPSQGAQVKANGAGTWIATGYYNYLARSTDGATFTALDTPPAVQGIQWLMGIAPAPAGHWWVAGEHGTLVASSDDGLSWTDQSLPTSEDLYAAAFFDAQRGAVVGSHGAVFLTTDGGQGWSDVHTGLDVSILDARWLDANTLLVVGGGGAALTRHVP